MARIEIPIDALAGGQDLGRFATLVISKWVTRPVGKEKSSTGRPAGCRLTDFGYVTRALLMTRRS